MNPRDRLEALFASWGRALYRHAWVAIASVLAVVAALATQLPKLEFNTSAEGFLRADDPMRVSYDAFREQFGRDERILVLIRTSDVFRLDFLEKLRAFHEEVEAEVPLLVDVTSLVNARDTRGEGDELIVEDLREDWPETHAELARVRERALANPLYRDQLLSRDGRITSVMIETEAWSQLGTPQDALAGFDAAPAPAGERKFLTGEENSAIVRALAEVVERHRAPDFEIYVAGTPTMMDVLQSAMRADMQRFTGLAVASIALLLGFLFRRVAGVVLPLFVVGLSVVSTLACMALAGVSLTLPTQILPSFLLAVGVGASVHVLVIFYQRRRRGDGREDAIAFALSHSGLAILMTSLTTAGGLLSFAAAELAPIADFGVFGPLGVGIALVYTIVLLPALIAVFPMREEGGGAASESFSQRWLVALGDFATRRAWLVVGAAAGLMALALAGALRIQFGHDPLAWFPEDNPFRVATELANDSLRGSMFLEVVVDTGSENGLHEPAVLDRMQALTDFADQVESDGIYVGKTVSLVDVVKEIHQALNENDPAYRAIPRDRQLVAQELLLFENSGSDDLEDLVDSRFSRGRITLKTPFTNAIYYRPFLDLLEGRFGSILGDGIDFEITGLMAVMGRTINAVVYSMAKTYLVAFAVITPLMILLIGQVRIGLVSMIPNLAPILITLGAMGWLSIQLDAFTLLIGSIAIGLVVDDTIHFLHNFRRYLERGMDVAGAVRETLRTTGQAMFYTSLVLTFGFLIYTLSEMNNLFYFGLLTGFTILTAFLADVILAPALMALVARPRRRGVESEAGGVPMEATR